MPSNIFQLYSTLFLIIVVAPGLFSCNKKYNVGHDMVNDNQAITASLSGRVLDNNHQPLDKATVTSGTASTFTDINGYFRLKNFIVKDPGLAFVKVEKDGFFTSGRSYQASSGSSGYVVTQLIKKMIIGNFSAASGGTVTLPDNGGRIDFLASGIVTASNNTSYTGTVSVAAYSINPTAIDFIEMMPGTLRGINAANQQVALQSYGMIAVELTGANNEKLQLVPGKYAAITFPVPTALQSQAPSTIPLWSFNESTGLWKEEGIATKQGSNYTGSVSHFSYWNCDNPTPAIKFKAKILDQNGMPLSQVKVLLKTVIGSNPTSGYGYTDTTGMVAGFIPANISLQLMVYNQCGDLIYTGNVGPFSGEANLGNVIVTISPQTLVRFTGSVTSCNGAPVADGSVIISIDNNFYSGIVTNGNFSFNILRCNNNNTTATITAFDNLGLVQSLPNQLAVNDTIVSTGSIQACAISTEEFLTYTFNGVTRSFTIPRDSLIGFRNQSNQLLITYSRRINQEPNDFVYITFPSWNGINSGPLLTGIRLAYNGQFYTYPNNRGTGGPLSTRINITENGAYLAVTCTADVFSDNYTSYTFTTKFRLKAR